jgi:hypothetical protein
MSPRIELGREVGMERKCTKIVLSYKDIAAHSKFVQLREILIIIEKGELCLVRTNVLCIQGRSCAFNGQT